MSNESNGLDLGGVVLPSWEAFEASSEALHLRSFERLFAGGLLSAAVVAAGGDEWIPDIDGRVRLTARGHLARGSAERIVGLRLLPRPVLAAGDEDKDNDNEEENNDDGAIFDVPSFGEVRPRTHRDARGCGSDVLCWDDLAELRVVGVGELISEAVYFRLVRDGGRRDRAQVREAVERAVDVVWETAWPVERRNPVTRLAQLRRVALPDHGLCEGTAAGTLTLEASAWPGRTFMLPSAQLNVGVDVANDGRLVGRGLPWAAALIPFSEHDPPWAIADGARAAEHAMPPAQPEPLRASGRLAGASTLGADVVVALVPLTFNDPAVVVSSELVDSARLSCVDESGRVRDLGLGNVLMDRHGSGGVVAEVRASGQLPHLADGTPVDVLVDPVHVVRWKRFGTLAEIEATAREIYDPRSGRPIDALAGVLHVLRQSPTVDRRAATTLVRSTLASVGWQPDTLGHEALVDVVVVPDPTLSSAMCGIPRGLWPADNPTAPTAALLVGSRPGMIRSYRVVPIDGDVVRVPATARFLFVAPWSGEPVTVAATTEELAEALASPAEPLIDRTLPVRRVTVAALQPSAVRTMLASAPATLLEITQRFERGVMTYEERTQLSTDKLTVISNQIFQALGVEATRAPDGLLAALSRAGVRMSMLAPLLVDREGRAGGPWLADYLGGVSAEVMGAAVAPSGPAVDWPARSLALTKQLIALCAEMHVTETDCGSASLQHGRRSPLGCRTTRGVCAMCVGALSGETSALPVGARVGLLGAVALSRELPDLWLHTFHVCGGHLPAQHGLLRFEELVAGSPTPLAAVLADRDGVVRLTADGLTLLDPSGTAVQAITQDRGRPFFAVNDGEIVETGSPLTVGALPLSDLARLRGSRAVDRYVADDMISLLEDRDIPASLIECVVRAIRVTWPWAADRP